MFVVLGFQLIISVSDTELVVFVVSLPVQRCVLFKIFILKSLRKVYKDGITFILEPPSLVSVFSKNKSKNF